MLQHKVAEQMKKATETSARNLPTEKKRVFWRALIEERKTLGEASEIAGIDDILVAAELFIQCHRVYRIPMKVDEIQ